LFDLRESVNGTDASVFTGQNGIFAPAVPMHHLFDLLCDDTWCNEAAQEHTFVSLRDIDLQHTHPSFLPTTSITGDLLGYDDDMQVPSNANYTSSATHPSQAEDSGLLQDYLQTEQITSVCKPIPRGRNAKRNTLIKEWLFSNASSPYPSRDQLSDLSISSGLSTRQVQVCLSNLRARTKFGMCT
jgi:hypothetical protein